MVQGGGRAGQDVSVLKSQSASSEPWRTAGTCSSLHVQTCYAALYSSLAADGAPCTSHCTRLARHLRRRPVLASCALAWQGHKPAGSIQAASHIPAPDWPATSGGATYSPPMMLWSSRSRRYLHYEPGGRQARRKSAGVRKFRSKQACRDAVVKPQQAVPARVARARMSSHYPN